MGEAINGNPVVQMHDVDGMPFQQFEQWQRPPSRQKEPNRAQNLDDTDPTCGDRNTWRTQAAIHSNQSGYPADGKRPRIDFFHQRINGSSDFANQYAALSFNAQRPPSRHKDPPQNQGLELPPDDEDIPSLDEDSDSSDEFEIGIEKAGGVNYKK